MPPSVQAIGIAVVVDLATRRCLVGRRRAGSHLAGMLEFPGGKSLPGESPAATAVRECLEETGVTVHAVEEWDLVEHEYPHAMVRLHFWRCEATRLKQPPHEPFTWTPLTGLDPQEFPAPNAAVIERLQVWAAGDQTASTHES